MSHAALFYPFHLCSRDTLEHLLARYEMVHFRNYMALQLSPMYGTTAFPDRIRDHYPDLYAKGRIVQEHNVSGPLSAEMGARVDRDLTDRDWREVFHAAVRNDPRFRRGFAEGHADTIWSALGRGEWWASRPMSLAELRQMSCRRLDPDRALALAYGMMLINTSAALWYTIQLCQRYTLEAATDSAAHDRLLKRIRTRDRLQLSTYLWRTDTHIS